MYMYVFQRIIYFWKKIVYLLYNINWKVNIVNQNWLYLFFKNIEIFIAIYFSGISNNFNTIIANNIGIFSFVDTTCLNFTFNIQKLIFIKFINMFNWFKMDAYSF